MMRALDSTTHFPYKSQTVCYVVVAADGTVTSPHTVKEKRTMAADLAAGKVRIFAAWPGQYRTDLFELTDAEAMRTALG